MRMRTSFTSVETVAESGLARHNNGDEDVKIYFFLLVIILIEPYYITALLTSVAKAAIEPFTGGDFAEYLQRLQFYFCANDISVVASSASATEKARVEKKMSAYLISPLIKMVYSTLKTLCLPASTGSMKFSELKIKTSRTTVTFLFRQCSQGPTETATEFVHKLKNKSVDCDFDAFLDRALRDQFIAGLRDIGLKKTILTKPDADVKTFQNVQEIALAEEAATRFADQMSISAGTASTSTEPTQVHHASSTSTKKSWQTKRKQFSRPPTTQRLCYRCGSPDHLANKCKTRRRSAHTAINVDTSNKYVSRRKERTLIMCQLLQMKPCHLQVRPFQCF